MQHDSWSELLDRVRDDLPSLIADFLRELHLLEGYADGEVPDEDLERTAGQVFTFFLDRLASRENSPSSSEFPQMLGRRRARQGIRIDHFLEGVRINFRLLWRGLNRAAQPDLIDELVAHGERVLNVVESYATEVQRAFLDETQAMAQLHRTARERALSNLFSGRDDTDQLISVADTLGLVVEGAYELIATPSQGTGNDGRGVMHGPVAFAYEDGEVTYLFRIKRAQTEWIDTPPVAHGAYISHVHGLAMLYPAAVIAKQLLLTNGPGPGMSTLRTGLDAIVRSQVLETLAGFEHELIGTLYRAPLDEQARLVSTMRSFMETGSVQQTAEELYVHRNTVFKRIRAFQDLTGLDVTLPRDAAIALIMLRPE